MANYRVALIGCGRPWKSPGSTGCGMNNIHVKGYQASGVCDIVALAEPNRETAELFQKSHGGERIYADYREMLAKEKPDIVSIAVWAPLHYDTVIAAADAGVKMIHAEKPIAPTWGEARRMVAHCREKGVQLTFNHQRRFLEPFRKAKAIIASGAIGRLQRLESKCHNMFDWGTHWLDMMFFLNDETPVDWVIGQVDLRGHRMLFDAPLEGQGMTHFKFRNGVRAFMVTGFEADFGCEIRAIGTEGQLELSDTKDQHLRVWKKGQSDWENIPTCEGLHGDQAVERAIIDAIGCLKTHREPELAARKALQSTEVIFATYESSRRRGRVDLPLMIDDSPLIDMIAKLPPAK